MSERDHGRPPQERESITEVFDALSRARFREDQLAEAALRELLTSPTTPDSSPDLIEAATIRAGISDERTTVNALRGLELSGEVAWTGDGYVLIQPPIATDGPKATDQARTS